MRLKIYTRSALEELVANPPASPNKRHQERMAKWEEGRKKENLKKSSKFIDMTNFRTGILLVVKYSCSTFNHGSFWEVKCDCGNTVFTTTRQLKSGYVYSCGCKPKPRKARSIKTHGKSKTTEFGIWKAMRLRCQNPNHSAWRYYGGRGISVCDKWKNFSSFYEDMGPRPSMNHTLDRINVNGNYEPLNCRWATKAQQDSNKRSNRYLQIGGVRLTVTQAGRVFNIPWHRIRSRSASGWPPRAAIFAPKHTKDFRYYE